MMKPGNCSSTSARESPGNPRAPRPSTFVVPCTAQFVQVQPNLSPEAKRICHGPRRLERPSHRATEQARNGKSRSIVGQRLRLVLLCQSSTKMLTKQHGLFPANFSERGIG